MTLGMRGSDQHRTRLGLLFLVIGIILVLWAWGSWVYRASVPVETEGAIARNVSSPSPDTVRAVRLSPVILLVGLFLVLLFFFGSYALVRAARRYRELADRKRPPPTPADDVWTMNKLRNQGDEKL
jgi:hypothetical protein